MTLRSLPQRITPTAFPGSLLKQARGEQRIGRAPAPICTDAAHLACIRECPCLKCGLDPCGEAAHVRMNSAAFGKRQALGAKPSDAWAVPLCRACHLTDADAQHKVGEIAFWNGLGINPLIVARDLYAATGDVVKMRAIVFAAIAARR